MCMHWYATLFAWGQLPLARLETGYLLYNWLKGKHLYRYPGWINMPQVQVFIWCLLLSQVGGRVFKPLQSFQVIWRFVSMASELWGRDQTVARAITVPTVWAPKQWQIICNHTRGNYPEKADAWQLLVVWPHTCTVSRLHWIGEHAGYQESNAHMKPTRNVVKRRAANCRGIKVTPFSCGSYLEFSWSRSSYQQHIGSVSRLLHIQTSGDNAFPSPCPLLFF